MKTENIVIVALVVMSIASALLFYAMGFKSGSYSGIEEGIRFCVQEIYYPTTTTVESFPIDARFYYEDNITSCDMNQTRENHCDLTKKIRMIYGVLSK